MKFYIKAHADKNIPTGNEENRAKLQILLKVLFSYQCCRILIEGVPKQKHI